MSESNSMSNDLSGVLRRVLELGHEDQKRLRAILSSLAGAPADAVTNAPASSTEPHPAEEPAAGTASQWLDQIRAEAPWSQVRLLDEALHAEDGETDLQLLRDARARLLQENPPLAVRLAVVRLATERPLAVCTGGVGLLLAVIALGRGVFRLVF